MAEITAASFPLREVLLRPECSRRFVLSDWDLLVQQARSAGLLSRVAALLQEAQLCDAVPHPVRWHLEAALTAYGAHREDVVLEIGFIARALAVVGIRPVLLKGAAYVAAGDRALLGRLYSDVDIFVPRSQLTAAEEALHWQGWVSDEVSEYDQSYYRQWMHELPPMVHQSRGIPLDVHHNLLPLTSRYRLDAGALSHAVVASTIAGVDTLAPVDRVLHSATHLLLGGEFDHAFRDLSDLRLLIDQFVAEDESFWGLMVTRAEQLGLGRVLFYALDSLSSLLDLPVPQDVMARTRRHAPPAGLSALMRSLFAAALLPKCITAGRIWPAVARFALYVRSHYLKMPLRLLLPHLARKSLVRFENAKKSDPAHG